MTYRQKVDGTVADRLLIKPASGVLAALRGSTYGGVYASPLRWLRPYWTVFLNSLQEDLQEAVIWTRWLTPSFLRTFVNIPRANECPSSGLVRGGWQAGKGDFNPRVDLVDVLVEMSLDDPIVIDVETFTECVLSDFESSVEIAPQ